ncbi:MAG: type I phosphomannose isomerase catalytic subunit [Phycisphaerae bacterium]
MRICPLIFNPIYKPKIWGGRRLEEVAHKKLDIEGPIGESWELADLENDQSVVRDGPAEGATLGRLVKDWGAKLTGRAGLFEGRFPLLIKYLDAQEHLSVQVHPDERMAKRLGGNVRVKNEAWYVLHTEPDGAIYRGFAEGVTRESFIKAIEEGAVASTLKRIPVKPGQCYYVPSGTIHTLGAGVVVAEIQTPSDITYRVYDWDRVDSGTGKGRALHIDQALECINFGSDDGGRPPTHVASVWTLVTRLVSCDSFIIERVGMVEGVEQEIPTGELIVWMILEGVGQVHYAGGKERLAFTKGDTVLIPAGLTDARIKTLADCKWLEVTIPVPSELADFPRPPRSELADPQSRGYVSLNPPDS